MSRKFTVGDKVQLASHVTDEMLATIALSKRTDFPTDYLYVSDIVKEHIGDVICDVFVQNSSGRSFFMPSAWLVSAYENIADDSELTDPTTWPKWARILYVSIFPLSMVLLYTFLVLAVPVAFVVEGVRCVFEHVADVAQGRKDGYK